MGILSVAQVVVIGMQMEVLSRLRAEMMGMGGGATVTMMEPHAAATDQPSLGGVTPQEQTQLAQLAVSPGTLSEPSWYSTWYGEGVNASSSAAPSPAPSPAPASTLPANPSPSPAPAPAPSPTPTPAPTPSPSPAPVPTPASAVPAPQTSTAAPPSAPSALTTPPSPVERGQSSPPPSGAPFYNSDANPPVTNVAPVAPQGVPTYPPTDTRLPPLDERDAAPRNYIEVSAPAALDQEPYNNKIIAAPTISISKVPLWLQTFFEGSSSEENNGAKWDNVTNTYGHAAASTGEVSWVTAARAVTTVWSWLNVIWGNVPSGVPPNGNYGYGGGGDGPVTPTIDCSSGLSDSSGCAHPAAGETSCSDGVDNDLNGDTDCDDPGCFGVSPC